MRYTLGRRRLAGLFADDRIAASMLSFCVSGTHRIKSTSSSPNAKFFVFDWFEANTTRETKTKSTNANAGRDDDDVLHERRNVMIKLRMRWVVGFAHVECGELDFWMTLLLP